MSVRKVAFAVLMTAGLASAAGVLLPAQASAASRIRGCFVYNGVRYAGLSTSVEYQTTANRWAYLKSSGGHTLSDGCVAYNITGSYRRWHLRIKATAVVPQWRGFFLGSTPYYAPGDGSSYNLGQGVLRLWILPPAAPTAPPAASYGNVDTSQWLNDMSGGGGGGSCSSSTAMQVACYMDQHGMHGNVVVLPRDFDGDGRLDDVDPYPQDKYRY